MANPPNDRIKYQKFSLAYSGEAVFTADGGDVPVPTGATARITIPLTTRPYALTSIRVRNLYEIPFEGVEFGPEGATQLFYPPQLVDYFARIDDDQDLFVDLAQQNVIVRPANQALVQGAKGIHWHPLACPYPFRGGNNVVLDVKRRTPYPAEVGAVTVQAVLTGWQYVSSEAPGGSPPSTNFDVETFGE